MKLFIQGKNQVELSNNDYLTSGGEGKVYVKGGVAFKIYNDAKKMISLGKIQELSSLTHLDIIKPEDILIDAKNKPVGYTMKFIKDTYALCQLFTKSFRDRNSVTPDTVLDLVRKLQEIIQHVHDQNILIVDLNELNFLVDQNFKHIYAIDVDSWKTPGFPATALMESIRDRHTKDFSILTDWFAFAIVSFQLFIGIHPYKGKHSKFKNLEDRMMKNISVLNKDVNIPSVCYPFSVIPPIYLDWYRAVLERGERIVPPFDLQAVATLVQNIKKMSGSNNFDIQEIGSFAAPILGVLFSAGMQIVSTTNEIYMGRDKTHIPTGASIVTSPKCNNVVVASIGQRKLKLFNATARENIELAIEADAVMSYGNCLYVKSATHVLEIQFSNELLGGKNMIASTIAVANVLEKATNMYDGVVFQNLLGAIWSSIFPESGSHLQIRIPELDDYKIVDAKYQDGVLMVVGGTQSGSYDKIIFRFNEQSLYDVRVIKDINPSGLNFTVLDNGLCIHLNEEENIEIFSKKKDSVGLNIIDDPDISGDMRLFSVGTKVLVAKAEKLYSLTMKRKS